MTRWFPILSLALVAACSTPPSAETFSDLRQECAVHYLSGGVDVPRASGVIPASRRVEDDGTSAAIRIYARPLGVRADNGEANYDAGELARLFAAAKPAKPGARLVLYIESEVATDEVHTLVDAAAKIGGLAPAVIVVGEAAPPKASQYPDPKLAKELFAALDAMADPDSSATLGKRPKAPSSCAAIKDAYIAMAEAPIGERCTTMVDGLAKAADSCTSADWDAELTSALFKIRPGLDPYLEVWVTAGGIPAKPGTTWGDVASDWVTGS